MNTQRFSLVAVAVVAALAAGSIQAADIVGSQTAPASSGPSISVGESTVEIPDNPDSPHKKGLAGIGVSTFGGGAKIDFDGLATATDGDDLGDGLTRYVLAAYPHPALGKFDFVQVAGADVWFGNWSQNADGSGNYQAYYVGDRTGTTLPASGTATYTVKGLNESYLLSGTFTADFGAYTLNGTLDGATSIQITDADINPTDGSFFGNDVVANGSVNGTTNGHFFGADAASLAGVAEFASDASLNTAFGGTKNP